jgi:DNA protecting protein DprA
MLMSAADRERLMLLNLVPDIGSTRLARLLEHFGSLDRVWKATVQEFQQVEGIGAVLAQRLVSGCRNERLLADELALAKQYGVQIVTLEDAAYPQPLRHIPDPPLVLYVRGHLPALLAPGSAAETVVTHVAASAAPQPPLAGGGPPLAAPRPSPPSSGGVTLAADGAAAYHTGPEPMAAADRTGAEAVAAVAVVGSRRASLYGLQTAERLAYELAGYGVTVVSGLARGVDGAAHRGALRAHGLTLAVLGNGLSRVYPLEHQELADRIVQQGALLSEYPMTMPPLAQNFPRRNRLISGLALGVVLVEAAHRSGALITCDCALEQGREVFAVPGKVDSPTSQGPHRLLREGARLVTGVEDILEELRLVQQPGREQATTTLSAAGLEAPPGAGGRLNAEGRLSTEEHRVLAQLNAKTPCDLDTVAAQSGLPAGACAAVLLQLELKRRVRQLPGQRFLSR